MGDFLFWIVGIVVLIVVVASLKGKSSSSIVVTGPGVRKIHDVECKFRTGTTYHGDLDQSRWSDGQERMEMNLRKLPGNFTGTVRMIYRGSHVADFEAKNGRIDFAWKGQADTDHPQFDINEEVRLEFGGQILSGIVEAD